MLFQLLIYVSSFIFTYICYSCLLREITLFFFCILLYFSFIGWNRDRKCFGSAVNIYYCIPSIYIMNSKKLISDSAHFISFFLPFGRYNIIVLYAEDTSKKIKKSQFNSQFAHRFFPFVNI
jgi:hypothetical protein